MKRKSIPKRGRVGNIIYSKTRHGSVARAFVPPKNPRTTPQRDHRKNVKTVTGRWRPLDDAKKAAWGVVAAKKYFINEEGEQVRLNRYHLFVQLNVRRADLGLPQYDLPPAEPVWSTSPVGELSATFTGGRFSLKLGLNSPLAHLLVLYAAAPVRSGVRYVSHFPFLALLTSTNDGAIDLTDLYVARYGVPKPNQAIWIRACQHADGWIDTPKVLRARLPVLPA